MSSPLATRRQSEVLPCAFADTAPRSRRGSAPDLPRHDGGPRRSSPLQKCAYAYAGGAEASSSSAAAIVASPRSKARALPYRKSISSPGSPAGTAPPMLASLLPHAAERQAHLADISPLASSAPSSAPSPHTPAASACSPGSSRNNSGSKVRLSAAQRSAIAKLVLSRLASASPSVAPVEQLAAAARPPSPPRTTHVRAAFFTPRHDSSQMSHGVFASHMFRADASPLKRSHDALEDDGCGSERFTELPAAPPAAMPKFQPFLHHVERRDSEHISPLAASSSTQMPSAVAVSTPPPAAAPRQHAPATWAHFYASEAAWAEGALAEARRISGERDEALARGSVADVHMASAPFAHPSGMQQRRQTEMPMSYAKRLRTDEAAPPRRNTDGPCLADGNASPGLVGVLSNFRDMLKSREAGCRGLEELAREAGRLGELDLLRTPPSHEQQKRDISDEEVD